MESTFLTTIDAETSLQHVRFACNVDPAFAIPEGLSNRWEDSLCRRALDEHRPYTDDLAKHWGDSDAARVLGVRTFVSEPVLDDSGELLGTLCAASPQQHPLTKDARDALGLFSALIGQIIERERLVERLRKANEQLASYALTDPLTGLPNRRAVLEELRRMLSRGARDGTQVLVGMVDLDGFKAINDTYGHLLGDTFLQEASRRLLGCLRDTDLLGRLGGDEFIVLGPGRATPAASSDGTTGNCEKEADDALALQKRCQAATQGHYVFGSTSFDYGGASVGFVAIDPVHTSPEEAIRLADAAMYAVKGSRRPREGSR